MAQQPTQQDLMNMIALLTQQVAALTTAAQTQAQPVQVQVQPQAPAQVTPRIKVNTPEVYDGTRGIKADTFINACELYMHIKNTDFSSDQERIGWAISFLTDKAARWSIPYQLVLLNPDMTSGTAVYDPRVATWAAFKQELQTAFMDPDQERVAERGMEKLRQTGSCSEYIASFRNFMVYMKWNDSAYKVQFRRGLKEDVKDELAKVDPPTGLADYMALAQKIDDRLWERRQEKRSDSTTSKPAPKISTFVPRTPPTPTTTTTTTITPTINPQYIPMDLSSGRGRLTPEEREKRFKNNLCLYCGQAGHRKSDHFKTKPGTAAATGVGGAEASTASVTEVQATGESSDFQTRVE